MKSLTAEWVAKAEGDYRVMIMASKAAPSEPDQVCYHAQQCVEKYAKGFLQEHNIEFARTHDMEYLHTKCASVDSDFGQYKSDFLRLDEYSTEIRYPGDYASEQDSRDAVTIVERLRNFIRQKLGLDQPQPSEGNPAK
jgi:HEPN domain-containing protein